MSNWKFFFESEDEASQLECEFEFLLSQLPDQILLPLDPSLSHEQLKDEDGPSQLPKQPRMEKQWHGNFWHGT